MLSTLPSMVCQLQARCCRPHEAFAEVQPVPEVMYNRTAVGVTFLSAAPCPEQPGKSLQCAGARSAQPADCATDGS